MKWFDARYQAVTTVRVWTFWSYPPSHRRIGQPHRCMGIELAEW